MGSMGTDIRLWSRREFGGTLLGAAAAWQEPTFTTGVKVVSVLATVRTKKGEIVRDLEKDDFELKENGRPQPIRYFSRESDLPLTLGLLVDVSGSQERLIPLERVASFRFLDQVLREKLDQVMLVEFAAGVFIRQELTSSRQALNSALSLIDAPTKQELAITGDGTRLYDAVIKSSEAVGRREGRKAIILLTDGVDVRSTATLEEALGAALKADVLVYSVLYEDSAAYPFGTGGPDGRRVLGRLSKETGGGMFEVSRKQNIDQVYGEIQQELRSQYSMGFVSDQPVRYVESRRIELATRRKGLVVQARLRYLAVP